MEKIKEAWKIAERIHKDQKRYNGEPYTNHIREIIEILREINLLNENTELYAILHDTMEDRINCVDSENPDLVDEMIKIDKTLPISIGLLTHTGEETYEDYIAGIIACASKNIIAVKLADMIQNLTDEPTKNARAKYRLALPKLIKALISK